MYVHEIKLSGDDEFAQRFNYVSELYAKAMDTSLSEEERKEYWKQHFEEKLALEQGY